MKITIVADKPSSAIWRLSDSIKRFNPHFDIELLSLHPKHPSMEEVAAVTKSIKTADILQIAYWKSGEKLLEFFDWTKLTIPKILCHYNPYDINKEEVNDKYDIVVVGNQTMADNLPSARHIGYGVDLDFFKFQEEKPENNTVLMVCARIEGKKGVAPVAKACHELGYKFVLVGRISKMEEYNEVLKACPGVDFREDINEDMLKEAYDEANIHVCNSVDNFESGTLPILEAMACGTPVLTRNVGHVPELYNGGNMEVRNGQPEDVEELKKKLKFLMDSRMLRNAMREKGWDTVKNWSDKRMAWKFSKMYVDALKSKYTEMPYVSIVIPTKDRPETLVNCLTHAIAQDYPLFEVIVVDGGENNISIGDFKEAVLEKTKDIPEYKLPPISYIKLDNKTGYSLARARNTGVMESHGDWLVFCDDRIGMSNDAVSAFVRNRQPHVWMYGQKDDVEKGFVENFSCVDREEFVHAGMFNETVCAQYGCMTQEIRQRLEGCQWSPFQFAKCYQAKAKSLQRTAGKHRRRAAIIESKLRLFKVYG